MELERFCSNDLVREKYDKVLNEVLDALKNAYMCGFSAGVEACKDKLHLINEELFSE